MPMTGYYDDYRIMTSRCPANCLDCLSPFDCRVCASGYEYTLQTSKCEPIPAASVSVLWFVGAGVVAAGVAGAVVVARVRKLEQLRREAEKKRKE